MQFKAKHLILLILCFCGPLLAEELPKQFLSEDAAVVLGIEKEKNVTEAQLKKTYRKLAQKYHRDTYKGSEFSKKELDQITHKIRKAYDTLKNYIKAGGQLKGETIYETQETTKNTHSKQYYNNNPNYDPWKNYSQNEEGIVPYGKVEDLQGTIFEELPVDVQQLHMHFTGGSPIIGNSEDLVIVFHRSTFPFMEARFYPKAEDGEETKTPVPIKTVKLTYGRGYHRGGNGDMFDALVITSDSYLLPMIDFSFSFSKIIGAPQGIYQANYNFNAELVGFGHFFNPGYNSRSYFRLNNKDIRKVILAKLPDEERVPKLVETWKGLKITGNSKVIALQDQSKESDKKYNKPVKNKTQTNTNNVVGFGKDQKSKIISLALDSSEVSKENLSLIEGAMALVQAGLDPEYKVKYMETEQEVRTADVIIKLATHKRIQILKGQGLSLKTLVHNNEDAETAIIDTLYGEKVVVYLATDRLWKDNELGKPKESNFSFVKTVVALAHELFGNALPVLEKTEDKKVNMEKVLKTYDRIKLEVQAYSRGIRLLEKIISKYEGEMPRTVTKKLKYLLVEEYIRLHEWENGLINSHHCGKSLED